MLNELHIENIAVIEKADISFGRGFNVLTGETGAGKSIVIDSIGAVLGGRVSRELVRRGAEKGTVTAVFDIDGCEQWLSDNDIEADDELIIQRRITAEGKSSCRVCGAPVTAAQLKELALMLVDIHGQNDGRQLMDEGKHQLYLDRFGVDTETLESFERCYQRYTEIKRELLSIELDEVEKARLCDDLNYRIQELERAQLKAGEYESLSSRRDLLRNSEKLTEAIDLAVQALSEGETNALSLGQDAAYYAGRASAIAPELSTAVESINSAVFALTDASELLRDLRDSLDFSSEEYDKLESRLSLLDRLERKYGKEPEELIDYLDECRRRLDDIQYSDERVRKLEKQLKTQQALCLEEASRLSRARHEAAEKLEKRIIEELRELNMPSVRFAVEFQPLTSEPGFDSNGCDRIRYIMSANAGEQLGRISKIASGGELSRIMLAMKNVFAENDPVQTMIFDEIDTGVSGIAAQRVGEKLYSVSLGRQVMCVTHLPQIAAMADNHYMISKKEMEGRTYTQVLPLDRQGRQLELARLHGGEVITETTLASAEEQLRAADNFKAGIKHQKK